MSKQILCVLFTLLLLTGCTLRRLPTEIVELEKQIQILKTNLNRIEKENKALESSTISKQEKIKELNGILDQLVSSINATIDIINRNKKKNKEQKDQLKKLNALSVECKQMKEPTGNFALKQMRLGQIKDKVKKYLEIQLK